MKTGLLHNEVERRINNFFHALSIQWATKKKPFWRFTNHWV